MKNKFKSLTPSPARQLHIGEVLHQHVLSLKERLGLAPNAHLPLTHLGSDQSAQPASEKKTTT